ncbi:MAG: hypothetical protein JSV80_18145 [Acidobacteriota bacterium]|nr:MAG: hypothetical protein JSV80_18145 [Acidobacteriota bacterium]
MPEDRQQLVAEADRAARRGDLARAAACYVELHERYPDDLGLTQRMGDALARSGERAKACKVFDSLAETYRERGQMALAIAALGRAVKLAPGAMEPRIRLAQWQFSQGLASDAESTLQAASVAAAEAGDPESELHIVRLLAGRRADDLGVQARWVALTDSAGDETEALQARLGVVQAQARQGRAQEAWTALVEALEIAPSQAITQPMFEAVVTSLSAPPDDDACPVQLEGSGRLGWSLVCAELLIRASEREAAEAQIGRDLGQESGWSAGTLVWAAGLLARLGALEAAEAALRRGSDATGDALPANVPGLARLFERFPELAARFGRAGSGDQPEAESATRTLPAEIEARVLEAKTLLAHGLAPRVIELLDELPPPWNEPGSHPRLNELRTAALGAGALAGSPASIPLSPVADCDDSSAASGPAVVQDDEGEDLFVVVDDLPPAPPEVESERPAAPAQAARSPDGERDADIELMASRIESEFLAERDDDETRFQMAVGMVEMGLQEHAQRLLRGCLNGGPRHWDAAAHLVRALSESGDVGDGLEIGSCALEQAGGEGHPSRVELLASLSVLAFRAGDARRGQGFLVELETCAPKHPLLVRLKGAVEASKT